MQYQPQYLCTVNTRRVRPEKLFRNLPQVLGREESRPRIAVELHTLDIDIPIKLRAPELEQNVLPGAVRCVSVKSKAKHIIVQE